MEGNSNKALILTMDNGSEIVAKVPCPNAGPKFWMTASEVATLMFCMYHLILLGSVRVAVLRVLK